MSGKELKGEMVRVVEGEVRWEGEEVVRAVRNLRGSVERSKTEGKMREK